MTRVPGSSAIAADAPAAHEAGHGIALHRYLDELPLAPMHFIVLAVCAALLCIDGYDVYLVGSLGPAITAAFDVPPQALTAVFLVQQIGLAAGSFGAGPVSDRHGRVPVLVICAAASGILTLAAAFAPTLAVFAAIRGVSAVFLGGAVPTALALLVEFTPKRRQGLFVALSFAGFSAGSASGAAVAAWLLADYGWTIALWIGGILALALVPVIAWVIPESVQFLYRRDTRDARIATIVGKLARRSPNRVPRFASPTAGQIAPKARSGDVFRNGLARQTILLWLIFFIGIGCVALILSWTPTFFHERGGISIARYSAVAVVGILGGLLGTITVGPLLDRFSATRVLGTLYLLTAMCVVGIGTIAFGTVGFVVALAGVTFFQSAGQTGANVLAARYYPAEIRATGVGFAFGAGRIGSIAGPAAGGAMLAAGWSLQQFFFAIGAALVVAAALMVLLGRARTAALTA